MKAANHGALVDWIGGSVFGGFAAKPKGSGTKNASEINGAVRAADAKEVGVKNSAEETSHNPNRCDAIRTAS